MRIFTGEFRKIWNRPLLYVTLAVTMVLNVIFLLFTDYRSVTNPRFEEIVYGTKEFRQQFAGPITEQWIQEREAEEAAILADPANRVGPEEEQEILKVLRENRGLSRYTDKELLEMDVFFLNKQASDCYNQYEDIGFAINLRKRVSETGEELARGYRERYPGEKGERFAQKAQTMYHAYLNGYEPYYGWHMGFDCLQDILKVFPYLVGVSILIALVPVFSEEYARKTDGLILTAKHGRKKVAAGKLGAGFLSAGLIWGIFVCVDAVLAFAVYGPEGARAFWPGGGFQALPYPWNQGQALAVGLATSLLGAVCVSGFVMLISSLCRSRFACVVIGAVLLLIPMIGYPEIPLLTPVFPYTATSLLRGTYLWETFHLVPVFGQPVQYQTVVVLSQVILFAVSISVTVRAFCRHQVKA